jgi:L-lactate permease
MPWNQIIDPFNNIIVSALVASIPVIIIFWSLLKKVKGYMTSLLTLAGAIIIAFLLIICPSN